jgi:hypothetical protein
MGSRIRGGLHVSETARGSDLFGIQAGLYVPEVGREKGTIVVQRWDADQTSWVSRKRGGEGVGQRGFWQPNWTDFHAYRIRPYSVTEDTSNLLVTAGWDRILTRATGGSSTAYASATTRIGVATGTAAAASGDTNFSATATGTANRWMQRVTGDGTVGTGTGTRRLSFVATVGTGDGNIAWQEWGIDQGATNDAGAIVAPLLNHAISNQGTKASGQTWTATALLDFT